MFGTFSYPWSDWLYFGIYTGFILTIIFTSIVIVLENRNPVKSLAWIVVLVFLPIGGFILYLFFGQQYRHTRMISKRKRRILQKMSGNTAHLGVSEPGNKLSPESQQQIQLGYQLGGTQLFVHNQIEIFTDGESKFKALIKDISGAETFIHLQYYIFANDKLGKSIQQLLMEKARQGVKIRILYDDVGCWKVKSRFFKEMRKAGIEIKPFFKVTFPQLANKLNYRNHRKVAVIDGKIGYIGGMNIADRYCDGLSWGIWRDTHARIKGPAVYGLQSAFSIDWSFTTREFLSEACYYPPVEKCGDTDMQILTSGPLGEWKEIAISFLKAIANARECIYIQTPYFLPTDSLAKALQTAALAKVDVRVMIPERSDSQILRFASFSYIAEMLKAGVKVYFYQPGLLHAKTVIIDDELCTVGSTNFDFRSFEHNFEANAFIYDREVNSEMKRIFIDDQQHCRRIILHYWRHRPLWQKGLESIMRLLSPVL